MNGLDQKTFEKIKWRLILVCVFLLTFPFYLRNKENWPCWCECSHPEKKCIREEKKIYFDHFFSLSFLCRIILVKQGLLRIPSQTVSLLIRFRFHFHFLSFLFLFVLVPKIPSKICKIVLVVGQKKKGQTRTDSLNSLTFFNFTCQCTTLWTTLIKSIDVGFKDILNLGICGSDHFIEEKCKLFLSKKKKFLNYNNIYFTGMLSVHLSTVCLGRKWNFQFTYNVN